MSDKNQSEPVKLKNQEGDNQLASIQKDSQGKVVIKPIRLKILPEIKHDEAGIEGRSKLILKRAHCKVKTIYHP
jgi:hypothetical protein